MNIIFLIRTFFTLVAFYASLSHAAFEVPSAELQQKIFLALRNEMIRLDGEGLQSRRDRPQTFIETTNDLANDIKMNTSFNDFIISFQKLSATYPNLHSRPIFSSEVNRQIDLPWFKRQSIWLFAETNKDNTKYKVAHIEDSSLNERVSEGDELVEINNRPISSWLDENFLFCKFPLRIQCDRQLEQNLLSLKLSWKGTSDLIYTIKHKNQFVDVKINFKASTSNSNPLKSRCDWEYEKRYKDFKLIHRGFFACLFEKENNPSVALLRIASFQYNRNQNPENPFKDIYEEVESLEKVWIPNSGAYKNLIIDVLDNHGGNLPIPYYQILFKGNFQEQYVQFKKTSELEEKKIREAIFWSDTSHELQFQEYLMNGVWNSLSYGDFTPPEPMFCADSTKPCSETTFEAKTHQFNGEVSVMLNEWCVSSCDGFVWAMKEKFNAKLYGFYQAADSAYARLRLDAIKDDSAINGFRIVVNPERAEFDKNFIVGQTIAVSRSTDKNGNLFNGYSLELESFVPYELDKNYPQEVLKEVLSKLR